LNVVTREATVYYYFYVVVTIFVVVVVSIVLLLLLLILRLLFTARAINSFFYNKEKESEIIKVDVEGRMHGVVVVRQRTCYSLIIHLLRT
jgi:hypothetical protein